MPAWSMAALGSKMLELSAERANGAHTYLVTPEHTAKARAQLGPAPWLVVEQAVVLETDPAAAHAVHRPRRAAACCPSRSRRVGRPASALLTGRMVPGGMTNGMTASSLRDAAPVAVWFIWRRQDPHPATHAAVALASDPYRQQP